ncbi:hypothetical protein, partial [Streptomyces sp. CS014]|uniref:hypothetical protein n=1 Tax=Streptomyces sp. CS014 TaxID=2162707 RepID=UPI001EF6EA14
MVGEQGPNGGVERLPVDTAHIEQDRLVEVVPLGQVQTVEPRLDRDQRCFARHDALLGLDGLHPGNRRQVRHRGVIEDQLRSDPHTPRTSPRHHLDRQDGITTQLEEVVVHADPAHPQD